LPTVWMWWSEQLVVGGGKQDEVVEFGLPPSSSGIRLVVLGVRGWQLQHGR